MEWGSTHVWMYAHSDEEFVSDNELEEGMWLSLSESESDDDLVHEVPSLSPMAAVHPSILKKQTDISKPPDEGGEETPAGIDLGGSTTKYLQDDDEEDEEEQTGAFVPIPRVAPMLRDENSGSQSETEDSGGEGRGGGEEVKSKKKKHSKKKVPQYVQIEHLSSGASNVSDSPTTKKPPGLKKPRPKSKDDGLDDSKVIYVKVDEKASAARGEKSPSSRLKTGKKPSKVHGEQVRGRGSSPPPPPRPPKGIIKNRLAPPGLKRVKRQRVKWERSGESRGRDGRDGRYTRRADTNVLAVKFNALVEPSNVHTGDHVPCSNANCTAILSHLSKISDHEDQEKDEKVWMCEFCGTRNEVDIVPEEMPTKEDTTFMISPAPAAVGGGGGMARGVEDSLVVFCIDISGSMCVSTEVPGKFELKGHDRVRGLSSLNVHNEDQYMPNQRRDVTYVSRLQSVQAAVDHQLTMLASSYPSSKVALVTFGDEVTVTGDGRGHPEILAGDKLWSSDAIVKVGGEVPIPAPIKDTRKRLSENVFDLEESGQTALGPALLLSISMAARVAGSKVIICTDGLANKGVGNLDGLQSAEDRGAAQTFYENMGTLALEKNVTVSLVRIRGTDCKALELGQVADKTGGQVTTVNPLNITKEFSSILANPVIATNVRTKIVLHSELYFRSEDSKESMLLIPVGNVTADTELSYEYGARTKKDRLSTSQTDGEGTAGSKGATASAGDEDTPKPKPQIIPPLKIDGKDHLPFQLQITYTGRDGSRCMRVITHAKPVTRDRDIAERDIDMGVVGAHVAHTTAKLTMEGEYTHARLNALCSQRLLQRTSHASSDNRIRYANLMEDIIPLENRLAQQQQSEHLRFGRQYSDEDDQYEDVYDQESELMGTKLAARESATVRRPRSMPKKKKAVQRRDEIVDDLAVYCYNMRATKSSDYQNADQDDDDDEEI